ncbi:fibrobacter succinogenes major paralogous domain-containing protein [Psychroserpens sp.]|uniref:fibrobacter succinogenes major paralogous domain-containing protein n=1 Tax=Psychroserpens sp. TaxID=2020870 RepID=UPI001B1A77A0|nr:fibrobacter succinogenes major paralogous domain-containing protein [Psychroserpens sp.]MBO6607222.1 fibrobacter succinogenes major paralogous domain-containing protein [Psychroserpens sp.]MBO6631499.1 fibrobacter succinogenes major paralogous domain-containing protein [Psychroserpens sp.]MBO6654368.1 fibrobacter succinogenes major paralogous domain-containing protein [Psychroserpens sp.]MBO6682346.1 fibrobacter succinogenes major paralogous domain-containing protein [Psychroserpens sp.]MBO
MKLSQQLLAIVIFALLSYNCTDDDTTSTPLNPEPLTVTDIDGNIYSTITVGNQIWMLENLKTTTFNDGTPITFFTSQEFGNNWGSLNDQNAFYQWADTFDLNNQFEEELPFDYYGAMYNHFAIESGKLAPEGWRIPTIEDFLELENYLSNNGQEGTEGEALKTTTGWLEFSGNGTDAIGFKGLPNGYINAFGGPTLGGGICTWATTEVNTETNSRTVINLFDQTTIEYMQNAIQLGAGIRCIKE